jgi:hypothetical protein
MEALWLPFRASLAKHVRLVSTNPSGCSAVAAHVLWEPQGPMRRRVGSPEHDRPSGEGTDYCAVREHGPTRTGSQRGVVVGPKGIALP